MGELGRETHVSDPELRVWADDLADLLDALQEHGTGVCVTVDEIHSLDLDQMQVLAGDIQMLIREGRRIALIMAGVPRAVEELLAGASRPTPFLHRAERPLLAAVPVVEVADSFLEIIADAGRSISDDLAMECAQATQGYPFMIQLVGYHVWRQAGMIRTAGYGRPWPVGGSVPRPFAHAVRTVDGAEDGGMSREQDQCLPERQPG